MNTRRIDEVRALLKREISVFVHETLAEEYGLVTLTEVEVTADFKEAKIYISVFEKEKEEEVLQRLEEEKQRLQHMLGKKLTMKFTPKIRFILDTSQGQINKVEELLKEIDDGA